MDIDDIVKNILATKTSSFSIVYLTKKGKMTSNKGLAEKEGIKAKRVFKWSNRADKYELISEQGRWL